MNNGTAPLKEPIDAMYLIHMALDAQARRVQKLVEELEPGDSLQPFRAAFNFWVAALGFHDEREDRYLTGPLAECADARENEAHHKDLWRKLEGVMEVVNQEIGKTRLIDRTKGHLFNQVLALRIAQEDHLENEETFLLPLVRRRMAEQKQLEVVRRLLIDDDAQEPLWVLRWVMQEASAGEREWLEGVMAPFVGKPAGAVGRSVP